MDGRIAALLVLCSLIGEPACCLGQDTHDGISELSREQWSQRIEHARCRSEEFLAKLRISGRAAPLPDNLDEIDAVASNARFDPSTGSVVPGMDSLFSLVVMRGNSPPVSFLLPANRVTVFKASPDRAYR